MGFVEDELLEVRKLCEHLVPGSRLISCVPAMVRVEIKKTNVKTIVACFQFPTDYPKETVLLELKSKTVHENLLKKLGSICEQEIKKNFGKPQVIKVVQFIRSFIDENPLLCCYGEITELKDSLKSEDEIKLKQKTSSVHLRLVNSDYYIKAKILVPDDYPRDPVSFEVGSNFPPALERFIVGHSREIVRRCVEPPLFRVTQQQQHPHPSLKQQLKQQRVQQQRERELLRLKQEWTPKSSLWPLYKHLLTVIRELPTQACQVCQKRCLPLVHEEAVVDETDGNHIERVYCGHLYHQDCLLTYMKTPPFQGGKKCLVCGERIYHDKWRVGERLAEDRWAHQEARQRELDEVEDFFK